MRWWWWWRWLVEFKHWNTQKQGMLLNCHPLITMRFSFRYCALMLTLYLNTINCVQIATWLNMVMYRLRLHEIIIRPQCHSLRHDHPSQHHTYQTFKSPIVIKLTLPVTDTDNERVKWLLKKSSYRADSQTRLYDSWSQPTAFTST